MRQPDSANRDKVGDANFSFFHIIPCPLHAYKWHAQQETVAPLFWSKICSPRHAGSRTGEGIRNFSESIFHYQFLLYVLHHTSFCRFVSFSDCGYILAGPLGAWNPRVCSIRDDELHFSAFPLLFVYIPSTILSPQKTPRMKEEILKDFSYQARCISEPIQSRVAGQAEI